ncbi:MAG: hypothetical protein K9J13_13020 [Saprospiraceae bacterium]|nr:hypothetical protein [Saprospiraceae bacterium]
MKLNLIIALLLLFSEVMFSQECLCGQHGYGSSEGDLPESIYKFSDSTKLAFCGYLDKKESDSSFFISEFNVFTCDSFENILGYSAVHYCNVYYRKDSIFINRLKSFPIGPDKEWITLPFSQRIISITNKNLDISEERIILEIPDSFNIDAKAILSGQFEKMNYEEISEYLGQLSILALKGNKQAIKILFSEKLNNNCDAAVAEHLRDCKEIYNWVVKGEKDKRHWW